MRKMMLDEGGITVQALTHKDPFVAQEFFMLIIMISYKSNFR